MVGGRQVTRVASDKPGRKARTGAESPLRPDFTSDTTSDITCDTVRKAEERQRARRQKLKSFPSTTRTFGRWKAT